ncbi:hypothetical protein GCM10007389_25680 [Pontibacter akesuensis]|nr:hypothetical protein GCM10007389_25680 [Pontibacter akesuensis]
MRCIPAFRLLAYTPVALVEEVGIKGGGNYGDDIDRNKPPEDPLSVDPVFEPRVEQKVSDNGDYRQEHYCF